MSNEQFDALAWAKRAAEALRACHNWMQGEFSDSDFDRDGQLSEADAAAFSAAYDADKAIAAIALMRGQSEPKLACYGLRKKGETGVIGLIPEKVHKVKPTSEEFLRDYEEVPLYFSPAQPKDTADEQ